MISATPDTIEHFLVFLQNGISVSFDADQKFNRHISPKLAISLCELGLRLRSLLLDRTKLEVSAADRKLIEDKGWREVIFVWFTSTIIHRPGGFLAQFGSIWAYMGPKWAHMGPQIVWDPSGAIWNPYEAIWDPYGSIWDPYGSIWTHIEAI